MSTAVVYYSVNGNSALAANALAEKLGAKLIELKEKKLRDLSKIGPAFMKAGMQAVFKFRSKLQGQPWQDASDCSDIHIITPIWASRQAPAVNAFVAKYDFKGKRVFLYTIQADTNDTAIKAREALANTVRGKGGSITGCYGLTGGGFGKEPNQELARKIREL